MTELDLYRYSSGKESTLGILLIRDGKGGRRFLCYTLEDEARNVKVYGETRIPAGRYRVALRTEGGKHEKYKAKFPSMHKGMLWIMDVPNFQWVLMHIGNDDDDTDGCVLMGDGATQNVTEAGTISSSTAAYKRVYPQIAGPIAAGDGVWLNIYDVDTVD
jgi:hypothetical protein